MRVQISKTLARHLKKHVVQLMGYIIPRTRPHMYTDSSDIVADLAQMNLQIGLGTCQNVLSVSASVTQDQRQQKKASCQNTVSRRNAAENRACE